MKDSNFVSRAIAVAAFVAVMIYFGVSIAGYLIDPLTTTAAYYYASDDAVTVSGYLVRDEEALPDTGGELYVTRSEGEKVAKGKQIAVRYASEETLEKAKRLQALEEQLEQLEYAQTIAAGGQAVLKMDESITEGIFAVKDALADRDLTAAEQEGAILRTLVLRRDLAFRSEDDTQSRIAAVRAEIDALRAQTGQGSTAFTAPRAGSYSALVDGYEAVLTPETLDTLTPLTLKNLQPDYGAISDAGKLIYGNTWYYAAVVDADEPLRVGQQVSLRFISALEKTVPMTVESVSRESGGERVVVLSADRYLSITTLLRHQNAQIIYGSYAGIRVPRDALRVVTETLEGENGEALTQRMTGVYCRIGMIARFKPVNVVYEGEDYYLVEADPAVMGQLTEKQVQIHTLRSGDEVIVTANDLYDGKVIGS